jgi:subtilisin family serine protease
VLHAPNALRGLQRAAVARRGLQRAALLVVALTAAAVPAAAQEPVLDPVLRRLAEPVLQQSVAGLGALRRDLSATELPIAAALAIDTDAAGRARIGIIVELQSAAGLAALRALGAEIGSVAGAIVTARVPLDVVGDLAGLPVRRVQAARTLRTLHDTSMIAIGADQVRRREGGIWTGSTGAGVIVGIIDTGIDVRHPTFRNGDGSTRLLGLWDQLLIGMPPTGFSYGHHCTARAVQDVLDTSSPATCGSEDLSGHGTHVAGTAAGNGAGGSGSGRYAGVAPAADLLIVKAGNGSFSEDRVIDGLRWLRDRGRALGRPVVVNLSLGHQYSAHDGTSLFERVIDDLSAPGFLIVLAAGNDGANDNRGAGTPPRLIHARTWPQSLRADTLELVVPTYPGRSGCSNFVWLSLFYDPRDRVAITVRRPDGTSAVAPYQSSTEQSALQGRITLHNAVGAQLPGTAEASIAIDGCNTGGPGPEPGTWLIVLSAPAAAGAGAADLYLHTSLLGQQIGRAYGARGFDNSGVVGTPGTARRGITVGAFATRGCWTTASREECYALREETGDLAHFSSGGPTRDGRMKPEITAPGVGIISALSRTAQPPPTRVVDGGSYWVLEGTSMAAPHVTGALALLLQHRPALAPEDVIEIFSRSAVRDQFTSRTYGTPGAASTEWWGHGKLNMPAALSVLLSGGVVAAVHVSPALDSVPAGGVIQLRATTVDEAGRVVFGGVHWRSLEPDRATVDTQGRVSGRQLGSARIVVQSGVHEDTALVHVAAPATLTVTPRSLVHAPVRTSKDEVLPVLALRLRASGPERVQLQRMSFEVSGPGRLVRVLVIHDANANGLIDDGDHIIQQTGRITATAVPAVLEARIDSVLIGRNAERNVIIALEFGALPTHGGRFTLRIIPAQLHTRNDNSQEQDRVTFAGGVAAAAVELTLLAEDEAFALSENPVRSGSVIFNFAAVPTLATVHTVTGTRVADLMRRIDGVQFTWDLTNDAGQHVVPGVYLLIFRVNGELIREKLMVLRARGDGS